MKEKMEKKRGQKETMGWRKQYWKSVRGKWFCQAFKLGFVQRICKTSLTFKSNLKWVFSIILKEKELYLSKHVAMESRCLKIWDSILISKLRQTSPL